MFTKLMAAAMGTLNVSWLFIAMIVQAVLTGAIVLGLPQVVSTLDFEGIEVILTIHGLRPIEVPTDRYEYLYAGGVSALARGLRALRAAGPGQNLRDR